MQVWGLRRGHRLWGSIRWLGWWLGLGCDVGRKGSQLELRRLALDGDGERDGRSRKPELIGDVGFGRLGPRLELDDFRFLLTLTPTHRT